MQNLSPAEASVFVKCQTFSQHTTSDLKYDHKNLFWPKQDGFILYLSIPSFEPDQEFTVSWRRGSKGNILQMARVIFVLNLDSAHYINQSISVKVCQVLNFQ